MGRVFVVELQGYFYRCSHCGTPLALTDDVISKHYTSPLGPVYLVDKIENVSRGFIEMLTMRSGMYTLADIFCVKCGSLVGRNYIFSHERRQTFKEGKFMLERCRVDPPQDDMYPLTPVQEFQEAE